MMETPQDKRLVEGMLFISDQPVTIKRLKVVLPDLDTDALLGIIQDLKAHYADAGHAFHIQDIAGGYQLVTDPELAAQLKRALELPKQDTLRKPALEALSIIAYRQPITKAEIEVIRGVDGSGTLDTLLERDLIKVIGRKETPGRPLLYGTTDEFLRHFGLNALSDLPPMADLTKLPMLPGEHPVADAAEAGEIAANEPQAARALPIGLAAAVEGSSDAGSSSARDQVSEASQTEETQPVEISAVAGQPETAPSPDPEKSP